MNLQKIREKSDGYAQIFEEVATVLVDVEVSGTTDENKKVIALFTARDMAMGALLKRTDYITAGICIGVGASALTVGIVSGIKRLRKSKKKELGENLDKLNDVLEAQLEIEKLKTIRVVK